LFVFGFGLGLHSSLTRARFDDLLAAVSVFHDRPPEIIRELDRGDVSRHSFPSISRPAGAEGPAYALPSDD
jgi:hypothetical protein